MVVDFLTGIYNFIIAGYEQKFLSLAIYAFALIFYTIIIWNYHKHLSKRDIFKVTTDPHWKSRLFSVFKYLFVFPLISFFWFAVLAFFMFFLAKSINDTETILLMSVTIISCIRTASYYNADLSRELAKMIPFTLIGVFIIEPSYFSIDLALNHILNVPSLLDVILRFMLFIFLMELVLRSFYNITKFMMKKF